jgi:hypothetical protein
MDSIMQFERECWICGTRYQLENHHIFGGANRKNSDKYGLTMFLCAQHHRRVHIDYKLKLKTMEAGQRAFESLSGSRERFMKIFGRSWL